MRSIQKSFFFQKTYILVYICLPFYNLGNITEEYSRNPLTLVFLGHLVILPKCYINHDRGADLLMAKGIGFKCLGLPSASEMC